MVTWSRKPFIYEINARVWLTALSRRFHTHITFANIPDGVYDELASLHVDAIWLMGVWTRSAAVRESALNYTHEYKPVLPDLTENDVIGSAYAIGAYEVDPAAGGREGLAIFREKCAQRGLKLLLDYVPNHVAVDHPWVAHHPTRFVRADERTFRHNPGMFYFTKDAWGRTQYVGHGRDPYFPGWIDTAQLNAFSEDMRQATRATLLDIASQCDGVRCDMAMLMTNGVFAQTWGWITEEDEPMEDFWPSVIPAIKEQHPDFLFIAEVYWNMEAMLQAQGFDYTYDKTLYDRLFSDDPNKLKAHLSAHPEWQHRTMRFIENHDEPRAASAFGVARSKAVATLVATVPGGVLLHDGQFIGKKIKLPVQIGRQPDEPWNQELATFYQRLLAETRHPIYQQGDWVLFGTTEGSLIAYGWRDEGDYRLIVINVTDKAVTDTVLLSAWGDVWALNDALSDRHHSYGDGQLTLTVEAFGTRVFHFAGISKSAVVTEPEREFEAGD